MRSYYFVLTVLFATTNAFSLVSSSIRESSSPTAVDRRAFFGAAAALITVAAPAVAIDDLAMPTEEESRRSDEEKMKERLRLKAELQKKASQPKNFAESLKGEKSKQQELQGMSKEERRNRLCEELGRGC